MAAGRKADYSAQIPQFWAADLYSQAENMTFWHNLEGPEGSSMPIIRKDDLTKQPGDTIKFDMVLALTGAGLTGDTTLLDGQEEKLKFRQQSVAVDALRNGVRWSKLGKILISHDMRGTALNQLKKWLAGKLDDSIFAEITKSSQPSSNLWACGSATTRDTIADGDATGRLKLGDISDLKAYAQANLKIEPLRMENGEEFYGLVVHPYANLSLKKDSSYQQAQRDANIRGQDMNPLFTGANFVWDGVIGYVSNRVPWAANVGSVSVANNVFFGAQALCRGYAYYPDWTEQYFSYGEEQGIGTFTVKGEKLNVFDLSSAGDNSQQQGIGSSVLYSAATAPTA